MAARALGAVLVAVLIAVRGAGGTDGVTGGAQAADEALRQRLRNFEERVCHKCAKRDVYCGCELGDANPPFTLLRSYARQACLRARWRVLASVRGGEKRAGRGGESARGESENTRQVHYMYAMHARARAHTHTHTHTWQTERWRRQLLGAGTHSEKYSLYAFRKVALITRCV